MFYLSLESTRLNEEDAKQKFFSALPGIPFQGTNLLLIKHSQRPVGSFIKLIKVRGR